MTLKELKSKFEEEVVKAGFDIDFLTLYGCSINMDADYFECSLYDTENEDKIVDYNQFQQDFFDKYKIEQDTSYNTGSYGDPYYRVHVVHKMGDLYFKSSYMYDSYNENEYEDDLKEVTPVQEVKVRFR